MQTTRFKSLAAALVAGIFAVGAPAQAQAPVPKASPDLLKKLEFRIPHQTKSDCSFRCERPISISDQAYCCTVCLDAMFICTIIICRCEIPLPGEMKKK
jgi:hypothetical protein